MRHLLILSALLLCSIAYADEQTRELPGFTSISTQSAFKLTIEVGKPQSIIIRGDQKFQARVNTEVIGNELVISYKDKNSKRISDDTQILITVPTLNKFNMQGAGLTKLLNINSNEFDIAYEGAGILSATGKVQLLRLNAKGVGLVDTKELIADNAEVNLAGIGTVSVYARNNLNVALQGIGNLTYYGHPRKLEKSVDGLGNVSAGD